MKIGEQINAIQIACQTTAPIRCDCFAPSYCATNVVAYIATPNGRLTIVQDSAPAGTTAAKSAVSRQARNSRSQNCITVYDIVEITNGMAIRNTSRAPHFRFHQSEMKFDTVFPGL
jgi:hypothetical protein